MTVITDCVFEQRVEHKILVDFALLVIAACLFTDRIYFAQVTLGLFYWWLMST